jgi:hypothetical protein
MQILITIVSFGLLVGLIVSPMLILLRLNKTKPERKFISFMIFALMTSVMITLIFSWWSDKSTDILLSSYGYDFDGMSDPERMANVPDEHVAKVRRLEVSRTGIGWPLKAIMTYGIYLPYLFIVYLAQFLINKYRGVLVRRG